MLMTPTKNFMNVKLYVRATSENLCDSVALVQYFRHIKMRSVERAKNLDDWSCNIQLRNVIITKNIIAAFGILMILSA